MTKKLLEKVESEYQRILAPNLRTAIDLTKPETVQSIPEILRHDLFMDDNVREVLGNYVAGFAVYSLDKEGIKVGFMDFDAIRAIPSCVEEGNTAITRLEMRKLLEKDNFKLRRAAYEGISVSDIFTSAEPGNKWVYCRSENYWEIFTFVQRDAVKVFKTIDGRKKEDKIYVSLLNIFPIERVYNSGRMDFTSCLHIPINWDDEKLEDRALYLCMDKTDIFYQAWETNGFNNKQADILNRILSKNYDETVNKVSGRYFTFNFMTENQVQKHINPRDFLIAPLTFSIRHDGNCNSLTSFQMFYEVSADVSCPLNYFSREIRREPNTRYPDVFVCGKPSVKK
jgi:hypothetical protein